LNAELKLIERKINAANKKNTLYSKVFSQSFENLGSLRYLFDNLDVQNKKTLIERVFGKGMQCDGVVYRTPFLNPVFSSKYLILSKKELLKIDKKTGFSSKIPLGVDDGSRTHDLRNHNPTL